jgi:hypothetical protein
MSERRLGDTFGSRPPPSRRALALAGHRCARYHRLMRFVGYVPAVVRGAKIDWEIDGAVSPAVRAAMKPQDVELLRRGKLRRPFHIKPVRPGTRGHQSMREEIQHLKGALVFATPDDGYFWFEAPDKQ